MANQAKDFPKNLYVGHKLEPQYVEFPAHLTLDHAISSSRTVQGRAQIAEYRLVRVVEARMVADIIAEVG